MRKTNEISSKGIAGRPYSYPYQPTTIKKTALHEPASDTLNVIRGSECTDTPRQDSLVNCA